jgi:hypothetical protein
MIMDNMINGVGDPFVISGHVWDYKVSFVDNRRTGDVGLYQAIINVPEFANLALVHGANASHKRRTQNKILREVNEAIVASPAHGVGRNNAVQAAVARALVGGHVVVDPALANNIVAAINNHYAGADANLIGMGDMVFGPRAADGGQGLLYPLPPRARLAGWDYAELTNYREPVANGDNDLYPDSPFITHINTIMNDSRAAGSQLFLDPRHAGDMSMTLKHSNGGAARNTAKGQIFETYPLTYTVAGLAPDAVSLPNSVAALPDENKEVCHYYSNPIPGTRYSWNVFLRYDRAAAPNEDQPFGVGAGHAVPLPPVAAAPAHSPVQNHGPD